MSKIPLRSEIPEKYTWNLQDIFESREAWEQGYAETEKVIASFRTFEGHVAEKPVEAVKAYYELLHHLMPVMSYASLSRECDNGNSEAQAMSGRAGMLAVQARSATSFLEPELLQMTESELSGLAKNPELSDYSEYFRLLIQQKNHLLSKEEEHLLALMGHVINGPDDIFTMLSSVDMKFPDMQMPDGSIEPLTEGTYSRYRESTNREVRKMSFDHIFSTYASFGSTIAAIYGTSVKKDNALAQARHYASALNAAMDPLEIPVAVYDNLIQVIHESIPLLTRYLNLRKKLMGQIGGNVLNTGRLITNLPEDACVEVPCLVNGHGIHPCSVGPLPIQCAAMNMTNINVQLLTIEAARTRKLEHVYQAAMLDPHTGSELDIDTIKRMVDELIEAHGDYLPKFH